VKDKEVKQQKGTASILKSWRSNDKDPKGLGGSGVFYSSPATPALP